MMPAAIVHLCCNFCELLLSAIPSKISGQLEAEAHTFGPLVAPGSGLPVSGCLAGKWREHGQSCFISPAQAPKEPTHAEGRNVHLSSCSAVDITGSQIEVQV